MQRLKWKRVGSGTSINMLPYKAKVIYKQREDILVKASNNFLDSYSIFVSPPFFISGEFGNSFFNYAHFENKV